MVFRSKMIWLGVAWLAACIAGIPSAYGQSIEEAAVRKAVEEYVAAFNAGDAKKLASMWTPEAVYINPLSGQQAVGREAIEQQFVDIFSESKGAQLKATTESVQFLSPSVAVEHGSAAVVMPEAEEGLQSTYTAVYVKRDEQWLLDRVTEEDVPVVLSQYEQLKELEWMIGTWVDQDEQSVITTSCSWTKNRNFIVRHFSLSVGDKVQLAGMQLVGWDPVRKQVRSWVFDSDGGFGEGMWTKKGDAWHIQSVGTLPDGQSSSAINIITYVDDNTFTWQSINREAGGQILPNVDEVVVARQMPSN